MRFNPISILFLILTPFFLIAQSPVNKDELPVDKNSGYHYKPYEVVLTFYDDPGSDFMIKRNDLIVTPIPQINQVFEKFGVNRFDRIPAADSMLVVYCTECDTEGLIEALSIFKNTLKFVEFHYLFELASCSGGGVSVNDPVMNQSLLNQISAQCAWDISTGDEAIVGLVDATGYGLTNNDIQNKVVSSQNYTNTTNTLHGHNMGGLIAAETDNSLGIPGIGFNADLRTYNIASSNTGGFVSSTAMISAINQARLDEVDVINMSFTWYNSGLAKTGGR